MEELKLCPSSSIYVTYILLVLFLHEKYLSKIIEKLINIIKYFQLDAIYVEIAI